MEFTIEKQTDSSERLIEAYNNFDWESELISYDKNNDTHKLPSFLITNIDINSILALSRYEDNDNMLGVFIEYKAIDGTTKELNNDIDLNRASEVIILFSNNNIQKLTDILSKNIGTTESFHNKGAYESQSIKSEESFDVSNTTTSSNEVQKYTQKQVNNNNKSKTPKAKDNKIMYTLLSGAGLIIVIVLLYVLVFKNDKPKEITETKVAPTTQEDLRKRELELKEREIALKEKEIEKQKMQQPNLNTPEGVVVKFIQSLGKQDWSAAFGLMSEKRRGSYSTFSSTKGYGGITSTKIYSCSYTGETNGKKEVMVDYESIDPSNKSGRFKQYYYLISFNDSYLITDIKNINIEWF